MSTHVQTDMLGAIVWIRRLTRMIIALVYHSHRIVDGLMLLAVRMHATTIQTFMHDLTLVRELSRVWSLACHHLLLSILHILKYINFKLAVTYLDLLVRSNL